jgi:hypothetical protein
MSKKRAPQLIYADQLNQDWPLCRVPGSSKEDLIVKARPVTTGGLLTRVKLAYKVFTGELDAVKWHRQ